MKRKQQSTLNTRNMQEVTFVSYLISYNKRDFYSYMLEDEDMRSSEDTEMKPLEKLL